MKTPPFPRCRRRPATGATLAALLLATHLPAARAQDRPATPAPATESSAAAAHYQYRSVPDPDGIGKVYRGREIAHVISGAGAALWLERPEREEEENAELLIKLLKFKPGEVVADIGAGTGYHVRRIAPLVGPTGLVYGQDIQTDMLGILTNKTAAAGFRNVRPVLGSTTDPRLPTNGVDTILMVDVYHEFDHPHEMTAGLCRALKPGGRLVFVEYRAEDPKVPMKPLHKMSVAQVRREMEGFPLQWIETIGGLPWQHIIVFRRTADHPPARAAGTPSPAPVRP